MEAGSGSNARREEAIRVIDRPIDGKAGPGSFSDPVALGERRPLARAQPLAGANPQGEVAERGILLDPVPPLLK